MLSSSVNYVDTFIAREPPKLLKSTLGNPKGWRRLQFCILNFEFCICTTCISPLANIVSRSEISLLFKTKISLYGVKYRITEWYIVCLQTVSPSVCLRHPPPSSDGGCNFAFWILNFALFYNALLIRQLRWHLLCSRTPKASKEHFGEPQGLEKATVRRG